MHALESRKHAQRNLEGPGLGEIEFNDFISCHCARVLHVGFYLTGLPALTCEGAIFRLLVHKAGVAKTEAESIKRLAR